VAISKAYWDELYRYMITGDRAFADANLADSTFSNNRWNLLLLFNPQGRTAYAGAFDLDAKAPQDVPDAWKKAIESRLPRLKPETDTAAVRGLLHSAYEAFCSGASGT
jgi:sensor domain CHASE-containing protein